MWWWHGRLPGGSPGCASTSRLHHRKQIPRTGVGIPASVRSDRGIDRESVGGYGLIAVDADGSGKDLIASGLTEDGDVARITANAEAIAFRLADVLGAWISGRPLRRRARPRTDPASSRAPPR